jgi:hypothetical protein
MRRISICRTVLVASAVAVVSTAPAMADQAVLVNGDRLSGKVTGLAGDAVLFDAGAL